MVMLLFVVYDTIAGESGPVFEAKNNGVALRKVDELLKAVKFRNEFKLLCVGSIDHETNVVTVDGTVEVDISLEEEDG